ncbi:ABC transporter permease [Roseateles chitinivorans]|uniref:ABC transporter permease n=1 Tax=Roseateles chitinivorans TaxID=2917965 RepID=UPI003D672198
MKFFFLLWRSLWYRPVRTALTLLSLMTAFLLLGVMQTVNYALSHPAPGFGSDIVVVMNRSSYGLPLPYAYRAGIESTPGVGLVSASAVVDGYYQDPKNSIQAGAVDIRQLLEMRSAQLGITAEQMSEMAATRTGAIVGPKIASKYGWKAGDRITMRANGKFVQEDGSTDWTFTVVGVLNIKDPSMMGQFGSRILFHYAYLDESRILDKGKVDLYLVKPKQFTDAAVVSQAIDARFANSSYETRSSPQQALALTILKQVGNVGLVIGSITAVVLATLAFMIGNAMMHTFHERIPEFAMLKTVGFSNRLVTLITVGESLLLCALGAGAGLGLAYLLVPAFNKRLHVVELSQSGLWPGVVMALLLAVTVALIPAWKAGQLKIVDALARRR